MLNSKFCHWKLVDGVWLTDCHHETSIYGVDMKFCPYCGKKLVEVKYKESHAN